MKKTMRMIAVWAAVACWGAAVARAELSWNESAWSAPARVDARVDFGGRLVHGREVMGEASGGAASAWDTTKLSDGWQEVSKGTNRATVAVLNAAGVAVEYGRLGADASWGSGKVHVVRDWVAVPSGRTLEIGAGTVVKFTKGTGIAVEKGGTLRLKGTQASPVVLTAVEDDSAGGDTDMREGEIAENGYALVVAGTAEDSGWTETLHCDMGRSGAMGLVTLRAVDAVATWKDGVAKVPVTVQGNRAVSFSAVWEAADGSARLGRDYLLGGGTLQWGSSAEGTKYIEIPLDTGVESGSNRVFSVRLAKVYGGAATNGGTATVTLYERGEGEEIDWQKLSWGESGWSGAVRADARGDFGGRLVHATETMGHADGVGSEPWDTTKLADGWQEVSRGTNRATVAVVNGGGRSVEYGRLGSDASWGSGSVHVVRDWVAVPSGRTLEIGAGTVVKFTRGTGIAVEKGGTLRLGGTQAAPVVLTAAEDDSAGGDTDMREAEAATNAYALVVAGTAVDSGWTETLHCDMAKSGAMGLVTLQIGDAVATWSDGVAKVPVSVSGSRGVAFSAVWEAVDGSASMGRDYLLAGGVLQWGSSAEGTKTIAIPLDAGAAAKSNRVFTVRLVKVYGGAAAGTGTGTVTLYGTGAGPGSGESGQGESEWSAAVRVDGRASASGTLLTAGDEWATWDTAWDGAARVRVDAARPDGTVATLGEASGEGGRGSAEWTADAAGRYEVRYAAHDGAGSLLRQRTRALVRLGDGVELHSGGIAGEETWAAGKVHVVAGKVTVGSGAALVIENGAVVKFTAGSSLAVESGGTCVANGVVFTHIADDTAGGDTMGDGNESAPVNDQYRVEGSVTTDAATELRYLTVTTSGTISGNTVWMGNRVTRVTGNVTVASGATLTVMPGAIVKFDAGRSLTVNSGGTLKALGTRAQPIVFTSVKDDEYGGDTNGDGAATTAQAGDWKKVAVYGTAYFEHAKVLYASSGTSTDDAILVSGGSVTFNNSELAFGQMYAVGVESGHFYATNSVIREFYCAFRHWPNDSFVNGVIYNCNRLSNNNGQKLYNTIVVGVTEAWDWSSGSGNTYGHCLFWNEPGTGLQGLPGSAGTGGGNKWGDPLFIDAENGDFRVRAGSACIDAGDGSVAPEADYFGRPRMNDPNVADTGVANGSGVCPDIGIYEMEGGNAASDVDLEAVRVSASAKAQVGGELDVEWTVANAGTEKAAGPWRDVLSLVNEATGETAELGEAVSAGGLAWKASKAWSGRFAVPAVSEGEWRVKVQVNAYRDVYEGGAVTNNAALSAGTVRIGVAGLGEDGTASGTAGAGSPWTTKVVVPEEGRWMLRVEAGKGSVVRYGVGFVPGEGNASGKATVGADGTALVSLAAGTTVYVTVEGKGAVSVRLVDAALAVGGVSPSELPGSGTTTLTVKGANFEAGAAVSVGGVAAVATEWLNAETLVATVDCASLPAGVCVVEVAQGDESASLPAAVTVKREAGKADLKAWLEVPGSVRQGRVVTIYVNYENVGNLDMPAPVLGLTATGLVFRVDGNEYTNRVNLLGLSADAPVGTLRPGEKQRVAVEAKVSGSANSVRYALTSRWSGSKGAEKPFRMETVVNPEWVYENSTNEMYQALLERVGKTWAEFHAGLGEYASGTIEDNPGATVYGGVAEEYVLDSYGMLKAEEDAGMASPAEKMRGDDPGAGNTAPRLPKSESEEGWLWEKGTNGYKDDNSEDGDIWEYRPKLRGWHTIAPDADYSGQEVAVIIHGNANSIQEEWLVELADALSGNGYTVIGVDWGEHAHYGINDPGVLANIPLVGWLNILRGTAQFIPGDAEKAAKKLVAAKVKASKMTLVGHSHGGHVAGHIADYYLRNGHGRPARLIGMDSSPIMTHPAKNRYPQAWDRSSAKWVEFYKSSWGCSMGTKDAREVFGVPSFHVLDDVEGNYFYREGFSGTKNFGLTSIGRHGYSYEWTTARFSETWPLDTTSSGDDLYEAFSGIKDGKAPVGSFAGVIRGGTMECGADLLEDTAEHLGVDTAEVDWRYEVALDKPRTMADLQNRMALLTEFRLGKFSIVGSREGGALVCGEDAILDFGTLANAADNTSTDYKSLLGSAAAFPWALKDGTGAGKQVWAFEVSGTLSPAVASVVEKARGGSRLTKAEVETLNKGIPNKVPLFGGNQGIDRMKAGTVMDVETSVPLNLLFGGRAAGCDEEGNAMEEGEDVLFVAMAGAKRNLKKPDRTPAFYDYDLCWDDDCIGVVSKVYDGRVAPIAEVLPGEAKGYSWRTDLTRTRAAAFPAEQVVDDNTWTAAKDGRWTVKLTGATSHGETNIVAGMWTGFDCTVRPNTWSENPNVTVTGRLFTDETGDLEAARTYNVILVVEDANSSTGMVEYAFTVHRPEDDPEEDNEDSRGSNVPISCDPNEMGGPDGVKMVEEGGTNRYVQAGRWMEYSIYFENKADAAASAQEVRVVNPLSEWLDWGTFEMGEVVFRNQVDRGLKGKSAGTSEVELEGAEEGWKVRTVLGGVTNGVAEWYLRVVDESTADGWPVDPYAGFLPPNDAEGNGEGRLTYRVKVRDDAPIGAVIRNSAVITFDYNAPIETDPAWWNIVEAVTNVVLEGVSAEGARSGDGTVEVVAGKPFGDLLPVPERTGWTFGGWFTGPDGTGDQVTAETVADAATLELFAKWVRAMFGELWLDVTHGSIMVGTNGVTAGFAPDGSAVEGLAERYVLTGTSSVHSVRFAGGSFTNTWTNLVVDLDAKDAVAVALEGASVEVTLEGNNFTASGEDCAGVRVDTNSVLTLHGEGRLEAYGGKCGAGIGGGKLQESGRVEIRAGTIEAYGGEYGAGIGGGLVAPAAGAVVVTGGSVKARGSDGGEDIGGGFGREGTGKPMDDVGATLQEVEVPFATDALPVTVAVDLGGGRTYQYTGMGHEDDTSLWFWLPDGTYEFEADGDDYGAHVAGAKVAAVFTDPGAEHFEAPAAEIVESSATGWRVGLNPAFRTTPFVLWTATGLDGHDWAWQKLTEGVDYVQDPTTGAVEWTGGQTLGLRVFKFEFLPKK